MLIFNLIESLETYQGGGLLFVGAHLCCFRFFLGVPEVLYEG